jgi:hypothetical protein
VPRGPINLITNNFKIKSQNHGIIYTYSVDFIEGESTAQAQAAQQASAEAQTSNSDNPESRDPAAMMAKLTLEESKEALPGRAIVRDLAVENLETF